jgi:hypothetical protein
MSLHKRIGLTDVFKNITVTDALSLLDKKHYNRLLSGPNRQIIFERL